MAPLIRIAEIAVDPAQVEAYRAHLARQVAAAVAEEPGVLFLFAVALAGHAELFRVVEGYRDRAAYEAHLLTPHFLAYKAATAGMVRGLTLIDTDPVALAAKDISNMRAP